MSDEEPITFANSKVKHQVTQAAYKLRGQLAKAKRRDMRDAWAAIETYLAVSMRVLDTVPLEQLKTAAVTEEIKARLHGRHVV